MPVLETVAQAAKVLDEVLPGWHMKVDPSKLNMGSMDMCVLGQACHDIPKRILCGYGHGSALLDKQGHSTWNTPIFSSNIFRDDWRSEISNRVSHYQE
jgi:hypothetical protein